MCIVWTPGHESLLGNEAADAYARARVHRAFKQDVPRSKDEVPKMYADILQHYSLNRRT